jgi:glutamyl-tRNA reductase
VVPDRIASRTIVCIGTSHRIASVHTIERAMCAAAGLRRGFEASVRAGEMFPLPVLELAVLPTCNRVEVYAVCDADCVEPVLNAIVQTVSEGDDACDTVFYAHRGVDAVRHLCRVATGLESLVVGEAQIAGQVSRAFEAAVNGEDGPSLLGRAARTAKLASRRARTETAISRKPASVSSVAVHVAASQLGTLDGANVLVVGAGKIGRLACEALRASGASITIANRTLPRAQSLATRAGATARPLSALPSLLATSDVVLTSTASPTAILDAALLKRARGEASSPLLIVDIAVPRNVNEDVRSLPDVTLIGIDDLHERLTHHIEERRDEIPGVEAIIEEVLTTFRIAEATPPLVGDLRRRAERIRHREIERLFRNADERDPELRVRMERLSRSLVNKLLHEPTSRLRAASEDGQVSGEYERIVRHLFALDDSANPQNGG